MKKIIFILSLFLFFSCANENDINIVYVQNMKLFSEFDLAIELDSELQSFSKARTHELDSLSMVLESMTNELELMKEIPVEIYQNYNDLRNGLAFREKNYEEELQILSQDYDQQIWERINGYVESYAEENNYDMILGAIGNGSLMYAKDTLDITDELIIYCNKNYSGK